MSDHSPELTVEQTPAWIERQYGHLWMEPADAVEYDDFSYNTVDKYNYLPIQVALRKDAVSKMGWSYDFDDFRGLQGKTRRSMAHGKHGRLNGTKLTDHRMTRRRRANTFRQMDDIWERDMAEPMSLSLDEYLDVMYEQEASEVVQIWSNRDYYTRLLKLNDIDDSFAETMDWDKYPSLQDHNHEADEREWYELDALTEAYHNGDFSDESTLVNLTMDDSEHYDPFYDYGPWSPEEVEHVPDAVYFATAGR